MLMNERRCVITGLGLVCAIGNDTEESFKSALNGKEDCDGVVSYNYFSGEQITGLVTGRPLVVRKENADFSFENFMRANLYSAVASLKIGLDILADEEKVSIDKMVGHGGFFKTPVVGSRIMCCNRV